MVEEEQSRGFTTMGAIGSLYLFLCGLVVRTNAEEYIVHMQAYAKHDGRLQYYCTTGSTLPKTTAAEIARPGSRVEVGVDAMRDVGGWVCMEGSRPTKIGSADHLGRVTVVHLEVKLSGQVC